MKRNFIQEFVFDNRFKYRFSRHLLFWIALFMFFTLQGFQYDLFYLYFKLNLLYLPLDIFTTYILIYFIYPKVLINKEYFKSFLLFILLLAFQYTLSQIIHKYISPQVIGEYKSLSLISQIFNDIIILFITYTSAIFIKTIKYLYSIEIRNHELTKKNIENKMALLTSQLHPHFLFNTLNNLYALSVEKSEQVPEIIMKLSDVIRYILYDYEKLYVKLLKEIEIVKSYIEIEKLRYNRDLNIDFSVEIPENRINKIEIPPLLLFTFVENAFKHGISQTLEEMFICIKIKTENNILSIKVENSTDYFSINKNVQREKIGLKNVKERLDLFYPKKYRFKTNRVKNRFLIYLEININTNEN